MPNEIYYVTGNSTKFEEAASFFAEHLPTIRLKQCALELLEIQTLDQHAIALNKAKQAWAHVKKPVLVDDTGVYFERYHNFPGTMTKYIYNALGLDGIFKLMDSGDRMSIRIVLVFMWGDNDFTIIEEQVDGRFDKTHRLDLHRPEAPFDTVFVPDGVNETVDELRAQGRATDYQYRVRALKRFEVPPSAY